jgi:hypothetical protein
LRKSAFSLSSDKTTMPALAPQATIIATMKDLVGALQPASKLTVQLCGYGSQVPRIPLTAMIAQTSPLAFTAGGTGIITMTLWGNDVITPANTYYTFTVTDENGNVIQVNAYQFLGPGTYDLSNTPLFNPPPPSILALDPVLKNPEGAALQEIVGDITIEGNLIVTGSINGGGNIYIVAPTPTPVFDGHLGASFKMTLTEAVTSSTAPNMSGKLLVPFQFLQDVTGGWAFVWPPTVKGGGDVNPAPNARSTQVFAVDTDGSLHAAGPMMYEF